jgi:hypothetical protein
MCNRLRISEGCLGEGPLAYLEDISNSVVLSLPRQISTGLPVQRINRECVLNGTPGKSPGSSTSP